MWQMQAGTVCLLWSGPFPSEGRPFLSMYVAALGNTALSLNPPLLCLRGASSTAGVMKPWSLLSGGAGPWTAQAVLLGEKGGLTSGVIHELASSAMLLNFGLGD